MLSIEKNVVIAAPIERVWAALTRPAMLETWMEDDSVQIDLRMGGKYQFFDGETSGKFLLVERPIQLEYTWRQREWPRDWPDSYVRWEIEPTGSGTRLRMSHTHLPNEEERNSHDEGWDIYFLEPLRDYLEGD